ncbi:MAG: type II toxin-antitoxin system VapC family toxin [Verrucomicrobia bacterium]|nr:type II toxin-antitoxin system VapC family toxin [Verrucomicrobiota bacterium]
MILGYADTGVMVKGYVLEPDSKRAVAIMDSLGEGLLYSHLHAIEIPNTIRLKRFRGEITKAQETAATRAFLSDIESGVLTPCEYDLAEVFLLSERLSGKHSAVIGSRSLDLLHVAAAMESGATHFASLDDRQRKVASLSGLKVIP